jgi:DNA processing protein
MNQELLYQLALTLIPNIGDVHARQLIQHFGNASDVFKAARSSIEKIEGIGSLKARSIKEFNEFSSAEKEIEFIEKYKITPLFITDQHYPQRLLNCYDAPPLLFFKGVANLNASRILAVVGTRANTEAGKQFTETLIRELAPHNITIISGLAYGIDAVAHKTALKYHLPTVGVVGHGLDKIYPADHAPLVKEMVKENGGMLSEFFSGTKPDKHNFPLRNRIVAGISDATIVVETHVKGGSMITAKLADAYNRDVFAVPGRPSDVKSGGCNYLIQHNKAMLLTESKGLLEVMGWTDKKAKPRQQRELFVELNENEKMVMDLLQQKESVHIDELNLAGHLSSSAIAGALLNLELQNMIVSMPGKRYKLS